MRLITLAIAGLLGFVASGVTEEKWTSFEELYKKCYKNREHELQAKAVFSETIERIAEHKVCVDLGEFSYRFAVNSFSDIVC